MDQARKSILLGKIRTEIEKKIRSVEAAHETTKDYQLAALGSASIGGDRLHAENNEQIQRSQLARLKNLENDLTKSENAKFITVEYGDDKRVEFYLLNITISLPGILIVTPDSPLGQAINKREVGEAFSLEAGSRKISGKIVSIE